MKTLLKIYLLFFIFLFLSHLAFHIIYLDSRASLTAYLVALRYDAATLAWVLGFPSLLYVFSYRVLAVRKYVLWIFAFLSHYVFVVLAVDLLYYGLVGKHATIELQIYFRNYIDVNIMGLREYPLAFILYAVSVVIFFILWKRSIGKEQLYGDSFPSKKWVGVGLLVFFIFTHVVAFRGGFQGRPLRPADAFQKLPQSEGDFALNGVYTTFYALFHRSAFPVQNSKESIQKARALFSTPDDIFLYDDYPFLRKTNTAKKVSRKNIVFIILESWSAKRVGVLGDPMRATPFFDSLAEEGWFFTNAYATGRRSIASLPAAISSIPTLYGSLYITSPFEQNAQRGLGTIFREQGYSTFFTYAAKAGSMGFNTFARLAGFEVITTREDFPEEAPHDGVWGVYDHVMFAHALKQMEGSRKPFLSVLYTLNPHPPFTLPEGNNFFKPDVPRSAFYNALKYSDTTLKVFFAEAKKKEWFKDTIFVLMADHAYEETKGRDAFHIPLLIYSPSLIKPRKDARLVSELDVLPTLIDLVGFGTTHAAMGKSILRGGERFVFLDAEHAGVLLHEKDKRVIAHHFGFDKYLGAFDMKKDPEWKKNLASKEFSQEDIRQMQDYIGVMGYAIRDNKIAKKRLTKH
ncbi:MAG: Phosphoglycerol transferase I [Turneriella sp.]|nr:Phosphoglycerol transferase I [Turneriella sp.]